ncbi:MAG: endo-1,4-beta-xylanase [Verrucomicrobiae bacterium]|nr:endo-1,4-beta-xylanase [Verrucomicrobiae bacterium]
MLLACALAAMGVVTHAAEPALKTVFEGDFLVGAAVNRRQVEGSAAADVGIVRRHFNTITPENAMKWGPLQPRPGAYAFTEADRFVAFGEEHGMVLIGHTLVWHQQTPRWVFEDGEGGPASRELLLERMRDHIHTVVGRYRGRIRGWDVVNEALNDDGTMRQSPWFNLVGEDYLVKAFEFAREADPEAELYYNDYSLEGPRKRAGAVRLLRQLLDAGAKVTAVGLQGHYSLEHPSARQIEETLEAFIALGLRVMITELDVNVLPTPWGGGADVSVRLAADAKWNPYTDGLPADVERRLADRYAELFGIFLNHRHSLSRVTFWGVTDASSWLNNFPIRGRTNYPLLFGRDGRPKPAFEAVVALGRTSAPGSE